MDLWRRFRRTREENGANAMEEGEETGSDIGEVAEETDQGNRGRSQAALEGMVAWT